MVSCFSTAKGKTDPSLLPLRKGGSPLHNSSNLGELQRRFDEMEAAEDFAVLQEITVLSAGCLVARAW